jgi:hypothetical protein
VEAINFRSTRKRNVKDWRHGSSSRAPALQTQILEFKPQSHQKKKRKERKKLQDEITNKIRAVVAWGYGGGGRNQVIPVRKPYELRNW